MGKGTRRLALTMALFMLLAALPVMTSGAAYSDVPDTHWAASKINQWTQKGYMDGYPDGTFKPEGDITRAEFVKITNKSFGFTALSSTYFSDVQSAHWFYQEVRAGVYQGYINGYPDGTFRPNENISRQEAAKIICTILNLTPNPQATYAFTDYLNIDDWARGYVGAVYSNNIMGRYSDGSFKARQKLTRAECVDGLWNGIESMNNPKGQDYTVSTASYSPSQLTYIRNLTINYAGDVNIQNVVVEGDVIFKGYTNSNSKLDDRTVTFKNSKVLGTLELSFGNLVLDGTSVYNLDLATNKNGRTVTLKNATSVTTARTDRSITLDQSGLSSTSHGIETLYVGNSISGATATLKGVFPRVDLARQGQNIVLLSGTIRTLNSDYNSTDVLLGQNAVLEDGTVAASCTIEGPGTVKHLYVESSGVRLQRYPDKLSGTRSPSYSSDWKLGLTITDINSGKAISGAKVTLGDGWAAGTTNSSGYVEFSRMPNRTIDYTVTLTNYKEVTGSVTMNGANRYATLTMSPTGSWRAELLVQDTATKKAIPGAYAVMNNTGVRSTPSGGSLSDGKIYFENLGNSSYTCKVSAPGYVSASSNFTISSGDRNVGTVSLKKTVTNITAYAESSGSGNGTYSTKVPHFKVTVGGTTYQSSSSTVKVEGLSVGSHSAQIVPTDSAGNKDESQYLTRSVTITVEDKDTSTVSVALSDSSTHTFSVSVLNWDGSAPVQGATVTLVSIGGTRLTATSDASGYANFPGVPASPYYKVEVAKSGYISYTMGKDGSGNELYQKIDAQNTNAAIKLTAYRSVSFTVTKDGSGISGMTLTLKNSDTGAVYTTSTTDGSGQVSIQNIPEGNYSVTGSHTDYSASSSQVKISGETNAISLSATDLVVTVSFQLTRNDGDGSIALPGNITLTLDTDSGTTHVLSVGSDGKTSSVSLVKGTYLLTHDGGDGISLSPGSVTITRSYDGQTLMVTVSAVDAPQP